MRKLRDIVEAIEGAPGKNKGYIDTSDVGEHKIHITYRHHGKGHYSPIVRVNGRLHRPETTKFDKKTTSEIAKFVKSSIGEFKENVKPVKFTMTANTRKKGKIYNSFATRMAPSPQNVKTSEFGATVSFPDNKDKHKESGHVPFRADYYPHDEYRRGGKKKRKKDGKDAEEKKKKSFVLKKLNIASK